MMSATDALQERSAGGALVVAQRGGAVWVTLNRPSKKNALTTSMLHELASVVAEAAGRGYSSVVFIGAGGEAFSSGFDLEELAVSAAREVDSTITRAYAAVASAPIPTIACISGWCIGAGLELALSCHLRVCSETARFQLPAGKIGIAYPEHGLARIAAAVGPANAARMIILSESLSADEALRAGLVNEVSSDPAATAAAWTSRIADSDGDAINTMLETLRSLTRT